MVEKASTNSGKAALLPAPHGNRRAQRHGAFVLKFTPAELAEVAELEDRIRELVPLESPSVEPAISVLAGLLWRRGRLYEYLDEHGLHRGRSDRDQLRPAVDALGGIERQIVDTMKTLAMTPRSASDLGLSLARLQRERRFDFERLSKDERIEFDRLASKAETAAEEWSDDAA
jgi:hypothetical protein